MKVFAVQQLMAEDMACREAVEYSKGQDFDWSSGRCARHVLCDACLILLHLLLVRVRERTDDLVSVTYYEFLSSVAFWL